MRSRTLQIAGIGYAFLLAAVSVYRNRSFYHDDAYITLRYARNYLAGIGLVWNPGEYVQGYTNFLHLVLVALLGKLGVGLVLASRIVGMAAFAGLVAVVMLFGAATRRATGSCVWYVPALLVATSVPMIDWSLGGLEGTLFSLAVAGGCFLFLLAVDDSTGYWLYAASGVSFGLSYLTRPDGIVFISVCAIWLVIAAWKRGASSYRDVMAYAAGITILVAPYVVWQVTYYGHLVPNTFYAKAGAPLWVRLPSGLRYLMDYVVHPPFLPILVFGSLVIATKKHLWTPKLAYLVISVSSYALFIAFAGGDHMPAFRLLLPLVPLMSALVGMVVSAVVHSGGRWAASYVTIALMTVSGLQLLDGRLNPRGEDPAALVGTIVGRYIADAWPEGSLVALNTAGSTPYYAGQHRYIDMLGLNDPVIAKREILKLELPWQRVPGHSKGDGAYVLSRHPDFIIVGPAEGTVASRPSFLSDLELSRDSRFWRDYRLRRVFLDNSGGAVSAWAGIPFTYYERIGGKTAHRR